MRALFMLANGAGKEEYIEITNMAQLKTLVLETQKAIRGARNGPPNAYRGGIIVNVNAMGDLIFTGYNDYIE